MAILRGFPPSNTISTRLTITVQDIALFADFNSWLCSKENEMRQIRNLRNLENLRTRL